MSALSYFEVLLQLPHLTEIPLTALLVLFLRESDLKKWTAISVLAYGKGLLLVWGVSLAGTHTLPMDKEWCPPSPVCPTLPCFQARGAWKYQLMNSKRAGKDMSFKTGAEIVFCFPVKVQREGRISIKSYPTLLAQSPPEYVWCTSMVLQQSHLFPVVLLYTQLRDASPEGVSILISQEVSHKM